MENQAIVYALKRKLFVHMSFGEWLRQKIIEKRLSNAELARRTGLSPTHIGNLVRNHSPNTKDGTGRPSQNAVRSIAKALDVSLDEARLAAGFAPKHAVTKPSNLAELIAALEDLGLPVPMLAEGWEGLIKDDDGFEEALDRIKFDLEMVVRRVEKGRKRLQIERGTLALTDLDLDDVKPATLRKIG